MITREDKIGADAHFMTEIGFYDDEFVVLTRLDDI